MDIEHSYSWMFIKRRGHPGSFSRCFTHTLAIPVWHRLYHYSATIGNSLLAIFAVARNKVEHNKRTIKTRLCFEWSPPWHLIHPIWHSIWHIYLAFHLAYLLTFYLAFYLDYLLTFYLAYLLTFCLSYLLTFCLSYLLTFCLSYLLTFYLAYLLTFYLAYLLTFYLADLLTFYLAYLLAFCLSYLLTFYLAYLLTFYLAFSLAFYMALFVTVEVRLKSGEAHSAQTLAGWSPARPTVLRLSHSDRELAAEVRRSPLRSRAGRWGPARPTAIKRRSGEAPCDQELADAVRQGRKEEGGRRKEDN